MPTSRWRSRTLAARARRRPMPSSTSRTHSPRWRLSFQAAAERTDQGRYADRCRSGRRCDRRSAQGLCRNLADAAAIATITALRPRICRPDRHHLSRRWSAAVTPKRPAAARDRQYQLPHLPGVPVEAVRAELERVIADPAVAVKLDPDASDASPPPRMSWRR